MSYRSFFYPKGVAVVGSVAPGKLGHVIIGRLLEGGMENIFAVNPKGQGMGEVRGCSSITQISPGAVELAIIASPAATVNSVLEDCGKAGVKAVAVITSGFSEAGNTEGEKELAETARKYGIRIIGPNCAGIVNTHANLLATLETRPPRGNIAIISQSGAVGGCLMSMAQRQGLGISKFVSFGNAMDIHTIDLLEWLKQDAETRVAALYLETVKNGREFMKVLRELAAVKSVVVVKSGRTASGQKAALSHTGSLAGSDAVFDTALRQCGAIRVETLEEMFDVCKGFSMLPPVKNKKLLIVTNSGGPGVMASDRAEKEGLEMPEPSENLKSILRENLPSFASLKNPLDLTVEGTGEQYGMALERCLEEYGAALAVYIGTPYLKSMPVARALANTALETGKPLAAILEVGPDMEESRELLKEKGIPCFESGERAVSVLARLAEYEKFRSRYGGFAGAAAEVTEVEMPKDPVLEPAAMELLKENGIPTPDFVYVHTEEEAVSGCEKIGYPVAMKVVSPEIIHKSEFGGVLLNIANPVQAGEAFVHLKKIAEGKSFQGAVIYPMLKGGKEVILGMTRDRQFGPVIAFGLGGIYTEVLKDVVFRVAPVDMETAYEMIREIRAYAILGGVRGEKSSDVEGLADTIVNFSKLPFRYPWIKEMDLNPVRVFEKGLKVLDVRIII